MRSVLCADRLDSTLLPWLNSSSFSAEVVSIWQTLAPSQGDSSYVVLDAQAPDKVRGRFKVGFNLPVGIDGTSETDGLNGCAPSRSGKRSSPARPSVAIYIERLQLNFLP